MPSSMEVENNVLFFENHFSMTEVIVVLFLE